ncbi:MAG TPA: ABC transporter substrate-binding protein [Alphaproteobacteria bacterium]|nr:ABC transporter substrate-binding protein [Alphaproteobacteria bacterium]
MRRRDLLAALAAAALVPTRLTAQVPPKMLRVGWAGPVPSTSPFHGAFRKRMAELGYEEGKNFIFEFLQVKSNEEYPSAYAELARRKLDIFMTPSSELALRAALAAAGTLPIVMLAVDFDPFEKGYVASLARPGGNVTGLFVRQLELAAKRVELTREALPKARILGFWWDAVSHGQAEAAAAAARSLGFEPRLIEVTGEPADYAEALRHMADAPGEPVTIGASAVFMRDRAAILPLLLARRTPAIAPFREFVEAGALMSYGISLVGLFRDAADYVDRIAKGAKPAELPIAQPTHFDMALNLKAAESLGISLPPSLTARADEVIE